MPDEYGNRLIGYVHILEFDAMVESLRGPSNEAKKQRIEFIDDIYAEVQKRIEEHAKSKLFKFFNLNIDYVQFSNIIVLSSKARTHVDFFQFFSALLVICQHLILNRMICLGAVGIGPVLHDKGKIFGPGLVDVYELQKRCAFFPRIIISDDAIAEFDKVSLPINGVAPVITYQDELLTTDLDGIWFLDYITKLHGVTALRPERIDGYQNWCLALETTIKHGLSNNDIYVRQGFEWMRGKYNSYVSSLHEAANNDKTYAMLQNIGFI